MVADSPLSVIELDMVDNIIEDANSPGAKAYLEKVTEEAVKEGPSEHNRQVLKNATELLLKSDPAKGKTEEVTERSKKAA